MLSAVSGRYSAAVASDRRNTIQRTAISGEILSSNGSSALVRVGGEVIGVPSLSSQSLAIGQSALIFWGGDSTVHCRGVSTVSG
jgi:hypothetical protein